MPSVVVPSVVFPSVVAPLQSGKIVEQKRHNLLAFLITFLFNFSATPFHDKLECLALGKPLCSLVMGVANLTR